MTLDELKVLMVLQGFEVEYGKLADLAAEWFCALCEDEDIHRTTTAMMVVADGNDNCLALLIVQTGNGMRIVELISNEHRINEFIARYDFLQNIPIIIIR